MRDLLILLVHLITTTARLMGPGGARSVIAESLLVKHQLLILCVSNSQFSHCIQDRGNVAWRLTSGLRCLAHEGPPAH